MTFDSGSGGGASRCRRDKQTAAVSFNIKEQRVLEKSLQTLALEETYALKLLELDWITSQGESV